MKIIPIINDTYYFIGMRFKITANVLVLQRVAEYVHKELSEDGFKLKPTV